MHLSSPRPVLLLLLLAACAAPASDDAAGPAAAFDEEAVRDSVTAVLTRVNAAATAKDVDAFMAEWARTDDLAYTRSGRTFLGWEEVAAEHRTAFQAPEPWRFETAESHVRALGPDAGAATIFIRTASGPAGGEAEEWTGWFTLTAAVARTADGWKVVQAHGSYPPPGYGPRGEEDPEPSPAEGETGAGAGS